MPTRNPLERLAAAGGPLLAAVEGLVDDEEEERILALILTSERRSFAVRRSRVAVLALAAAVLVAAVAAVAAGVFNHAAAPAHHRLALTGPKIKLAGFHFRTPAGFTASKASCAAPPAPGSPTTVMNGFAAAASADGGCVEAFFMIAMSGSSWTPAQVGNPVSLGAYQGWFVPADSSGQSTLYVQLPTLGDTSQYLLLHSEGLTEDKLVAVAQSGLPQNPSDSRTMGPT
jgi:hypothetical protein